MPSPLPYTLHTCTIYPTKHSKRHKHTNRVPLSPRLVQLATGGDLERGAVSRVLDVDQPSHEPLHLRAVEVFLRVLVLEVQPPGQLGRQPVHHLLTRQQRSRIRLYYRKKKTAHKTTAWGEVEGKQNSTENKNTHTHAHRKIIFDLLCTRRCTFTFFLSSCLQPLLIALMFVLRSYTWLNSRANLDQLYAPGNNSTWSPLHAPLHIYILLSFLMPSALTTSFNVPPQVPIYGVWLN